MNFFSVSYIFITKKHRFGLFHICLPNMPKFQVYIQIFLALHAQKTTVIGKKTFSCNFFINMFGTIFANCRATGYP